VICVTIERGAAHREPFARSPPSAPRARTAGTTINGGSGATKGRLCDARAPRLRAAAG